MKKISYIQTGLLVLLLTSCSLPAMIKASKDQGLTVTPSPLELHNGVVQYKINARLPVKMLKKDAVYTLNSYYKYGDKELMLDPISFRAEDFPKSNVSQPEVTQSFSFPYNPAYQRGVLEIQGVASKGGKTKKTPRMEIVTGIITTPLLVQDVYYVAYADSGYNNGEEIISINIPDFIFAQGRSTLRRVERKSEKAKKLNAFIASKNITKQVTIVGAHSPEGTEKVNKKLSEDRAVAIENYYRKQMDKYDYKDEAKSIQFVLKPISQNWTDFKKILTSYKGLSTEKKQLYLDIITNGNSFVSQEKELKKIPSYKQLFKEIYPILRTAKTEIITIKDKKSDEEILMLSKQIAGKTISLDTLSFKELMYAATLTPSLDEKEVIYLIASKKQKKQNMMWNVHNNLGAVYLQMAVSNPSKAEQAIQKATDQLAIATKIQENPEIHANLASIALMKKNYEKVQDFAKKALEGNVSSDLVQGINGVKGASEIHTGSYSHAVASTNVARKTSTNIFNNGLAHLLEKNYSRSIKSFNEVIKIDDKFALAYYASALVASHTGTTQEVVSYLAKAIKLDAQLMEKVLKDIAFSRLTKTNDFKTTLMNEVAKIK